jgi:hypothetical protein
MTDSESSLMAIIFGLAVFALIVAIGWRSVQKRRILRFQGPSGQETIIVAREDDDISSVVTTTSETAEPAPAPAPAADVADANVAYPAPEPDPEADAIGRDRLSRVVSSAG